ncbi:MAG: hypothetical protein KHZ15_12260 [Coprobacillus cateniformis]|uniref:hypothetical protein n=1 Tax=Longibaculum muris TaxID=1796628 RepID=UPI0012B728EA|nr:hypothetical protein [Longibaculum muris]MBS5113441.1 hypothetical protein [Coprobacillus cateniformis]
MIFIYIIGGLIFLALAIYLLDKREKMAREIKIIKEYRQDIDEMNNELDELQTQLDQMNEPLSRLNEISKKILSYMK